MSIYLLDGKDMTSREAAYELIAREMDFPDYFGKNLDALYDCLTEKNADNTVIFVNTALLEEYLGDYAYPGDGTDYTLFLTTVKG